MSSIMKKISLLIAAIFAGALLFSCQSELGTDAANPAVREYSIAINATKALDTKALALSSDGKSLSATWEDGEQVAVCKIDDRGDLTEVLGMLAPSTFGSASTVLTGSILLDGVSAGDKLFLQYPYKVVQDPASGKLWLDGRYSGQDGDLNTVSKEFAYATCGVDITSLEGDALSTTKAEFFNRQAIVKFSLQYESAALQAFKLRICAPSLAERFWHDDYYVNWGALDVVSVTAATSEFTVALRNQESEPEPYTLYAVASDGVYTATTPTLAFADGTYNRGTGNLAPMSYAGYDADSDWTITGSIASYSASWGQDLNMWTDGHGRHVAASVSLGTGDAFKFRKDCSWDRNYGAPVTMVPDAFEVYQDGGNMSVTADGIYDIYLDENTYTAIIVPASNGGKTSALIGGTGPVTPDPPTDTVWSIVGEFNSWGNSEVDDVDMVLGSDDYWVSPETVLWGEFKIRMNHAWEQERGAYGDGPYTVPLDTFFEVTPGGQNLVFPQTAKYIVAYDPDADIVKVTMTGYPEPDPDVTYTVAGESELDSASIDKVFTSQWNADESNKMVYDSESHLYVWSAVLSGLEAPLTAYFKVVKDHSWSNAWPSDNYKFEIPGDGTFYVSFEPYSGAVNAWFEAAPEPTITIDGNFDDWAAVDASKLAVAVCADGASRTALQVLKVGASADYVFLYLEFDASKISWNASEFVPINIYFNSDGDAGTGGWPALADACTDYLIQGMMTDGVNMVSYNPGVYKWTGAVHGDSWSWSDEGLNLPDGICQGAGSGNKYEICIDRNKFPDAIANDFSLGVGIEQDWDDVGLLPNATVTLENPGGVANSLQVHTLL